MARLSKDREVDTFAKDDTERLLRFNITKQRIVDLGNAPFEDDWFDTSKDYSSWNRALNGHPVWEGLVQALEDLLARQTAHPRQYLPADDPADPDTLATWMKQIAGAPWWHDVLQVSASRASFEAWYAGRSIGKDKLAEIKASVDEWWARVMAACARAELASLGREFRKPDNDWPNPKVTSHFYHLVVEQEMPVEQARVLYQDMLEASFDHHSTLIDLTDPKDPLVRWDDVSHRDAYGQEFDAMVAEGYPGAVPQLSPPFEPTIVTEQGRWGDRRNELAPKDLNEDLYDLHYRVEIRRCWDPETRSSILEKEITETSRDGVTWEPATARQREGWDEGFYLWSKAMHEGTDDRNCYTRELADLHRAFSAEKALLQKAIDDSEIGEQEDRAWAAMNAAEAKFEEAKIRLRLPE